MIINHNITALNTHRQLSSANNAQANSMEKLASGLRINKAGDDAAGLAISEKMRGQIRGLDQAQRNAQDGISLIQTAEGALNESQSILQRMRELSVQAANDTNTASDRGELQKEVNQLSEELTRIADNTEFNTQNLLGGDFEGKFQIGANEGQNLSISIEDMGGFSLGMAGSTTTELTGTVSGNTELTSGTYTIDGDNLVDKDGNTVAKTADSGLTYTSTGTAAETITFTQQVDSGEIVINGTSATGTSEFQNGGLEAGDYSFDSTAMTLNDSKGNVVATTTDGQNFLSAKDGTTNLLTLDAAATADTDFSVGGIDVSSQSSANSAITKIQEAIDSVSAERSKLGATQNRLDHTINNLGTTSENLTAAESRIRDVDMAKEVMNQTKQSILAQASQAMLAKANQQPQGVLQLLR